MKRILVADDEPEIQRLLKTWLERADYYVLTCNNGQEALEILSRERVDAIVVDIMMPVMDGLEFARMMKGNPGNSPTPMIALSGRPNVGSRAESLAQMKEQWKGWFADVIFKPCSRDTILTSLNAAFANMEPLTIQ